MRFTTALLAAAILAFAAPALASDKKKAQEPVEIMLPSYEVPPEGGGDLVDFTVFVEVYDQEELWDVCYGEPKIRDAFTMYLLTRRVKVDADGKAIVKPLEKRFRKLANRALKKKIIKRIHLVPGQYDKEWKPKTPPPVPNHRDCKRIELRTKRIK